MDGTFHTIDGSNNSTQKNVYSRHDDVRCCVLDLAVFLQFLTSLLTQTPNMIQSAFNGTFTNPGPGTIIATFISSIHMKN